MSFFGNYGENIKAKAGKLKETLSNMFTKTGDSPMGYKEAVMAGAIMYKEALRDAIPFGAIAAGVGGVAANFPRTVENTLRNAISVPVHEKMDEALRYITEDPSSNVPEGSGIIASLGFLGYGILAINNRYQKRKSERRSTQMNAIEKDIAKIRENAGENEDPDKVLTERLDLDKYPDLKDNEISVFKASGLDTYKANKEKTEVIRDLISTPQEIFRALARSELRAMPLS